MIPFKCSFSITFADLVERIMIMSDESLDRGVYARETPVGTWEVFCNYCRASLGTMSLGVIRAAIFATLTRGGVLCPACRKVTCEGCGAHLPQKSLLSSVNTLSGDVRLCPRCEQVWIQIEPYPNKLVGDASENKGAWWHLRNMKLSESE